MKFVSIVLPTLLVFMFQSSFAISKDKYRKVDMTAEIEDVQALIQDLESADSGMMDVNAQTAGGPLFQLQLLLRDLIRAIGNLSRTMARRCQCGQTS